MQKCEKNYRDLPDYDRLVARWLENYDSANYDGGLAARILTKTHGLIESPFGPEVSYPRVLEVGAGTMAHFPFVRHRFDLYVASDFDQSVLNALHKKPLPEKVELQKLDGGSLPFADDSFDRLIATHVLEHIPSPHLAIREWVRVIKPGGVLSLILPCDPGMAWRAGRYLGPRKKAELAGLPYDYYMAREHVNSIYSLHQILSYHFTKREVTWWPFRVPIPDLNFIYAGNFYV
jgi:phosphatidylethanolamine/phosphatidyl-N-methylethanolamine N-methyltransferase